MSEPTSSYNHVHTDRMGWGPVTDLWKFTEQARLLNEAARASVQMGLFKSRMKKGESLEEKEKDTLLDIDLSILPPLVAFTYYTSHGDTSYDSLRAPLLILEEYMKGARQIVEAGDDFNQLHESDKSDHLEQWWHQATECPETVENITRQHVQITWVHSAAAVGVVLKKRIEAEFPDIKENIASLSRGVTEAQDERSQKNLDRLQVLTKAQEVLDSILDVPPSVRFETITTKARNVSELFLVNEPLKKEILRAECATLATPGKLSNTIDPTTMMWSNGGQWIWKHRRLRQLLSYKHNSELVENYLSSYTPALSYISNQAGSSTKQVYDEVVDVMEYLVDSQGLKDKEHKRKDNDVRSDFALYMLVEQDLQSFGSHFSNKEMDLDAFEDIFAPLVRFHTEGSAKATSAKLELEEFETAAFKDKMTDDQKLMLERIKEQIEVDLNNFTGGNLQMTPVGKRQIKKVKKSEADFNSRRTDSMDHTRITFEDFADVVKKGRQEAQFDSSTAVKANENASESIGAQENDSGLPGSSMAGPSSAAGRTGVEASDTREVAAEFKHLVDESPGGPDDGSMNWTEKIGAVKWADVVKGTTTVARKAPSKSAKRPAARPSTASQGSSSQVTAGRRWADLFSGPSVSQSRGQNLSRRMDALALRTAGK